MKSEGMLAVKIIKIDRQHVLSPARQHVRLHFFLVYDLEAIFPADIMWKSPRIETYQEGEVDEARQLELDSIEEIRCNAITQSTRYLQGVRRYCNTRFIKGHKLSNHIRASIKSHVYTTE
jgi:hypothetical protein